MIDEDDHCLPLRLPARQRTTAARLPAPAANFGRRPVVELQHAGRVAPSPGRRLASNAPQPLIVRYNRSVAIFGVSMLAIAGRLMHGIDFAAAYSAGKKVVSASGGSATMADKPDGAFLIAAIIAGLLGLIWIIQGVTRARALTIDASGIHGFTLLGTRHFAWSDISRIETNWNAKYKRQLIIHAVYGSATGGYGILSPTQIPVMTAKINRSVDEILAAVRQYRPDIDYKRNESPAMIRLTELLLTYTKRWHLQ